METGYAKQSEQQQCSPIYQDRCGSLFMETFKVPLIAFLGHRRPACPIEARHRILPIGDARLPYEKFWPVRLSWGLSALIIELYIRAVALQRNSAYPRDITSNVPCISSRMYPHEAGIYRTTMLLMACSINVDCLFPKLVALDVCTWNLKSARTNTTPLMSSSMPQRSSSHVQGSFQSPAKYTETE